MTEQISHYGLLIDPMPTQRDTLVYAELTPSSPLISWVGFKRPGWRKYWPFLNGRTFKEPFTRWWFEIHETGDPTKEFPDSLGMHWHEHDGGAMTLRQAMWRAASAVNKVVDLADKEATK